MDKQMTDKGLRSVFRTNDRHARGCYSASGTVNAVVKGTEEEAEPFGEEAMLWLRSAPESWDWIALPKATAGNRAVAPGTRDLSLHQAEHEAPGADRNSAVRKRSGEQLHSCRSQG